MTTILTEKQFVSEIEGYSSDADYENLHYYMEVEPTLFNKVYPIYVKLHKRGVDDRTAIKRILEEDLGWAWKD